LSEPLVKNVRSGPKIHKIDVPTLEKLISDLNDCELYARAHKQTNNLDSSVIIDIGERLPFYFKIGMQIICKTNAVSPIS